MLEKYRPSMTDEDLRSWAEDAQNKIDKLTNILDELNFTLGASYSTSVEGIAFLVKISDALNT